MRTMRKQILTLILSLAVVMAYMPITAVTAFADETEENNANSTVASKVTVDSIVDLQSAIEMGAEYIEISQNLELENTIFVTNSTTIYSEKDVIITRAADFDGDMFIVGEDQQGHDVIGDLGKEPVNFSIGKKDQSQGVLTIDGQNKAALGTAIYVANSSTVDLYANCEIINCQKTGNSKVTASDLSKGTQVGGAAVIVASGTLNLRGATLANNTVSSTKDDASSLGGAIYNYSNVRIYEGTIIGGNAAYGGSIYNYRSLKIFDAELSGNNAMYGGAIAQADSQYAQTIFGNSIASGKIILANNSAQTGGGFYSTSAKEKCVNGLAIYPDADVTFQENSATNNGGAIYTYATVKIDGVNFDGNTAKNGGAVYYNNGQTSALFKNITIENGSTTSQGGAMYFDDGTKATILDSKLAGNTSGEQGGAMYIKGGSIKAENTSFLNNTSTSIKYGGGAIYLTGATLDLNRCEITGNICTGGGDSAQGFGGAIALYSSSNCTLNEVTIKNNTANYRGGAIYCSGGNLKIYGKNKNSLIEGNSSGNHGGAISFNSSVNAEIYKTDFVNNKCGSGKNGGALWVYQTAAGTVRIQDCSFSGNQGGLGSAINVSNASILKLYNNTISPNKGTSDSFLYETTTGTDVTIIGLTATGFQSEANKYIYGNANAANLNIDWSTVTCDGAPQTADVAVGNLLTVNDIDASNVDLSYVDYDGEKVDTDNETEPVPTDSVQTIFDLAQSEEIAMDPAYNPGPALNNNSNFQSLGTKAFGQTSIDTFVYKPAIAANNPNVGEGILIYEAMLYKKAHPEEDVSIRISSYRFSPEAAVNINRNSQYFGYMRSLADKEMDEYGFVRIAYLLVSAAKMGINVDVIGQREGSGDATVFDTYFASHNNDACDSAYASGDKVKKYLTCTKSQWDYTNKSATDLMHTKACAVSNYIDAAGAEHGPSVWLSSSNLDNVKANGTNGYDALQTGVIISDHEIIYKVTTNYLDLIKAHSTAEGVYEFRNKVNKMATEQIDILKAGGTVPADQQIVYIDDTFELYFSAIGGDNAKWDETYNCMNKQIKALANSDDYIWFAMNNPKYDSFPLGSTMQKLIARAFYTNKNIANRIDINISTSDEDTSGTSYFDTTAYENLTVGSDIKVLNVKENDYNPIHSKDMLLSYSKNGLRSYVTLISSMNMHEGSASYQSNFALIIKESDCSTGSVFRTLGENSLVGFMPKDLGAEEISIAEDNYAYCAEEITPAVTIEGVDAANYDVAYENNIDAGTATVVITGKNDYIGVVKKEFVIEPVNIQNLEISVPSVYYTGKEVKPEVTVKFGERNLVENQDFTVSYENNVNAGNDAKAIITGQGNFAGTIEKTFSITNRNLADEATLEAIADYTYTGKAIEPSVVVTLDDGTVLDASEYEIEYSNNKAAGIAKVTVTGIATYNGKLETTFKIAPADFNDVVLSPIEDVYYAGEAIQPEYALMLGDVQLVENVDYTALLSSNLSVGTATLELNGINNFAGSKTVNFEIMPVSIEDAQITGLKDVEYSGEAQTPEITIVAGGVTLGEEDADIEYSNNVDAGTATIEIRAKGNFTGTKEVSFEILQADIENAEVGTISAKTYTGNAIMPSPTVTLNGKTLVKNTDYELSYMNNTNAGEEAIAIITGKGNYTGETAGIFTIKKASLSSIAVSNLTLVYNGSARKATFKFNGKTLPTAEYSVAYYKDSKATTKVSASNVKNVGTYYVKLTSKKINFASGSIIKKMVINPKAIKLGTLTAGTKKFTAKWSKLTTQTTGYQVRYSTKSSMASSKTKTITSNKTTTTTISSLKAKTYYYVQIRTYKTVSGVKYYSSWSAAKKIKTK